MAAASGSIFLYMYGTDNPVSSGIMPLYMEGATSGTLGGLSGSRTLYISGDNEKESGINLYMYGYSPPGSASGGINISMGGRGEPSQSVMLPLFMTGSDFLTLNRLTLEQLYSMTLDELNALPIDGDGGYYYSRGMNLYISGDGLGDGFTPFSGGINLYMVGPSGAESNPLNLYMNGYDTPSGNINLYMFGVSGVASSGLNLYMSCKDSISSETLKLFIRGWNEVFT